MKYIINFRKLVSLITTICLLFSFVIGPTTASAMTNEEATKKYKQIFTDFMLPYNYGQIVDSHYAGTDRVIINIQDLHCHPQVQKNISNIIETFDKSYGVKKVFLEGAYGQVSTSWITRRIDKGIFNDVLEKMLQTGRLTGAEYFSAISGKTDIINGLENKEPYLENLKRFGDIVLNQEKINLILKAVEESTEKLKNQYYTKRQFKLEELSKQFRDGTITPQKYYALLLKHIERLGIDLSKYENTYTYVMLLELQKHLDYSKITTELQSLVLMLKEYLNYNAYQLLVDNTDNFSKLDKLYGYIIKISRQLNLDLEVNFAELDKYFRYIELSQKINPLELISEEEKLTQEVNIIFSETEAQREVVFLTNFEKYLKDYVSSKITSDDYEYYKNNIDTYKTLWNKYVDNQVLNLLDQYIEEADKFYKINTDRNIYFTDNMFKDSDILNRIEETTEAKTDINKIIDNMKQVKEVDVVITGGFHSQTVTKILRNQGVSYIVVTPNVTGGTKLAEETYYQLAQEQSKISFQALATLIVSLLPVQKQQELIDIISTDLKRENKEIEEGLSNEERKELLKEIIFAKMAESDDVKSIVDIVNENLSQINQLTEEEIAHIKQDKLPELLDNKELLEKVASTLKESTLKQSITLIMESIDKFSNIQETEKNTDLQQQSEIAEIEKMDNEEVEEIDQKEKVVNFEKKQKTKRNFKKALVGAIASIVFVLTLAGCQKSIVTNVGEIENPVIYTQEKKEVSNIEQNLNYVEQKETLSVTEEESISNIEEDNVKENKISAKELFDYSQDNSNAFFPKTIENCIASIEYSNKKEVVSQVQLAFDMYKEKFGVNIDKNTEVIFVIGSDADPHSACAVKGKNMILIPVENLDTVFTAEQLFPKISHEYTHILDEEMVNEKLMSPLEDEVKAQEVGIIADQTYEHNMSFNTRYFGQQNINHVSAMSLKGFYYILDNKEKVVDDFRKNTGNNNIDFDDLYYYCVSYGKNNIGVPAEEGIKSTEVKIGLIYINRDQKLTYTIDYISDTGIDIDGTYKLDNQTSTDQEKTTKTQLTMVWLSNMLDKLGIKDFNKRQKIINIIENPIIVLSMLFPTIENHFVKKHLTREERKDLDEDGEEKISKVKKEISFIAETTCFDFVPSWNTTKKIKEFVLTILNRQKMKSLATVHTKLNKESYESNKIVEKAYFNFKEFKSFMEDKENSDINKIQMIEKIFEKMADIKDLQIQKDIVNICVNYVKEANVDGNEKYKIMMKMLNRLYSFASFYSPIADDQAIKLLAETTQGLEIEEKDKIVLLEQISDQIAWIKNNNAPFDTIINFINSTKDENSKHILLFGKSGLFTKIPNLNLQQKDILFNLLLDYIEKNETDLGSSLFYGVYFLRFFTLEQQKQIYEKAINLFPKIKNQTKVLSVLIQNIPTLKEQQNEIFDISMNFIKDGNKDSKLSILNELFKEKEYFGIEKNVQILNELIDLSLEQNNLGYISDIIKNVSKEEFGSISLEKQKKVMDYIVHACANIGKDKVGVIIGIASNIGVLDKPTKDFILKKSLEILKSKNIEETKKLPIIQALVDNFNDFDINQQKIINKEFEKYGLDFVFKEIGHQVYTNLISKIKGINFKIKNRKILFNVENNAVSKENKDLFANYKLLEQENIKALSGLANLSNKNDLKEIHEILINMSQILGEINKYDSPLLRNNLIDKVFENIEKNWETLSKKQTELHGYSRSDMFFSFAYTNDITINDLINYMHQEAISEFKEKIIKTSGEKGLFNFSNNGTISPEMRKILFELHSLRTGMSDPLICFDDNTLVMSLCPYDRHSMTVLINTNEDNKTISYSFYDSIYARNLTVSELLKKLGFKTSKEKGFIQAKLDKDSGLTSDVDLVNKFAYLVKIFVAVSQGDYNGGMMDGLSLDEYIQKYWLIVNEDLYMCDIEGAYDFDKKMGETDFFNEKNKLDEILKNFDLPTLPEDSSLYYEVPTTHAQIVTKEGVDKFNDEINRAFAKGQLVINKEGELVRNIDYDLEKEFVDLLENKDGKIRFKENQKETILLNLGTMVNQFVQRKRQMLNLRTEMKLGGYVLQTGYLELINGEYLDIKILKDSSNDMIRYAKVTLVSLDGTRKEISEYDFIKMLEKEGFSIQKEDRDKGEKERAHYLSIMTKKIDQPKENKEADAKILWGETKGSIFGKVVFDTSNVEKGDILFKNYLEPDDMDAILNASGLIVTSGTEGSHAGMIAREKGKPISVISNTKIITRNGKNIAQITINSPKGNVVNENGIQIQKIETEIIEVSEGEYVCIDTQRDKVIVLGKDFDMSSIKQEVEEVSLSTTNINEEKKKERKQTEGLQENVKGFIEQANEDNFGTKSTNLHKMFGIIDKIKSYMKNKAIVKVPYGIMIGEGAFNDVLKQKPEYEEVLSKYLNAINNGNVSEAKENASQIVKMIDSITEEEKANLAKEIMLQIKNAKNKGLINNNAIFAVRSTFVGEDGAKNSSAGVGESFIGVEDKEIVNKLMDVLKSMYSQRSVEYQCSNKQAFLPSALVQEAVDAKKSLVMYVTKDGIRVSGAYGLGESVVSGKNIQTEVLLDKEGNVIEYTTRRQSQKIELGNKVNLVKEEDSVSELFTNEELLSLSEIGNSLSEEYGYDADIEIAIDKNGKINVLQIRPITYSSSQQNKETVTEKVTSKVDTKTQIDQIEQEQQQEEKVDFIDIVLGSINPAKPIIELINNIFENSQYMTGKTIIVDSQTKISNELRQQAKEKGINIVDLKIVNENTQKIRGGQLINEQNKIRMKFNKNKNELIVYSKKGINFGTEDIKELIASAYSEGRQDLKFKVDDVIGFAQRTDTTIEDIEDRIKNAKRYAIRRAETEINLDLSKENIKDLSIKCNRSTNDGKDGNVIILNAEQVRKFKEEIKQLQQEGFKFIVTCEEIGVYDSLIGEKIFVNGAIITGKVSKDAIEYMSKIANIDDNNEIIETQMYIDCTIEANKELAQSQLYEKYGILPIVDASSVNSNKCSMRFSEEITGNELARMLSAGNIINIVSDNVESVRQTIAKEKKSIFGTMTELFKPLSKEQRFSEEVRVTRDSKEDFSISKNVLIKELKEGQIKQLLVNSFDELSEEELANKIKSVLPTIDNANTRKWIEELLSKNKVYESLGVIRGSLEQSIEKIMLEKWNEKEISVNKEDFLSKKYSQVREIMILDAMKLFMYGTDVEQLINEDISSNESVQVLLDRILSKVAQAKIEIINNKYAIKEIETESQQNAIADEFKNFNMLAEDMGRKVRVTEEVKISALAVKSILSAA